MDADLELVKRCLAGDELAWEALLTTHTRKVYNLCYRFTGRYEDAQDLTQEIFIKIFQALRSYDSVQGTFRVWLNRVARNHLVDHYRRTRRDRLASLREEQQPELDQIPGSAEDPIARIERRERKDRLQKSLDKLSPDLREAVILRDLQDLDYAEIAEVLGVPVGTVKSRINRGRLELARVLKRME